MQRLSGPNTGTGNGGNPDGTCPASPPVSQRTCPVLNGSGEPSRFSLHVGVARRLTPRGGVTCNPSTFGCPSGTWMNQVHGARGASTTPDNGHNSPDSPGCSAAKALMALDEHRQVEYGARANCHWWQLGAKHDANDRHLPPSGVNNVAHRSHSPSCGRWSECSKGLCFLRILTLP